MTALDQIREGAAPAELAGSYRDIRQALRLTYVPLLFRALAPHRGVLKTCWHHIRPNVTTFAFEEAADWLRARFATAAVELGTPLIEPVLASVGFDVDETDELREQVDLFHYADPKSLLCLSVMDAMVNGSALGRRPVAEELRRSLPLGPPADVPSVLLLPEEPGGVVGELFHEIRSTLHLPASEIDLRALGHWPEFLQAAWREVGAPLFRHQHAERSLEALVLDSQRAALSLPFPLEPVADSQAMVAAQRVLETLRLPLIRLALFTSALKVSLDGAQEALDSPFPVEWEATPVDQLELPP